MKREAPESSGVNGRTAWAKKSRSLLADQSGKTFVSDKKGMLKVVQSESFNVPESLSRESVQTKVKSTRARTNEKTRGLIGYKEQEKEEDAKDERVPTITKVQDVLELISKVISSIREGEYPVTPGDEVKQVLESEKDDRHLAQQILEGWSEGAADLILHGEGWQNCSSILPPIPSEGKEKGLYLDFLTVSSLKGLGPHVKVYGGMAAGARGLRDRVSSHKNAARRKSSPSFHYLMMDLPDTVSTFRTFATYPQSKPLGFFLLAEGIMIAFLALYESPIILKALYNLGVPTAATTMGARPNPTVGLNNEGGLVFRGWDDKGAAQARSEQAWKKAIRLITTGFPVSIKATAKNKQTTFCLIAQHSVTISAPMKQMHPEVNNHEQAIAFLDLSPNTTHPHSYYGFETEKHHLKQFGLWIQLGDQQSTGFWVEETEATASAKTSIVKNEKRKVNVARLAEAVCDIFGMARSLNIL